MKQSRRNIRNEALRAEKRSDGPPPLSKYAAKHRPPAEEPKRPQPGGVVTTG